MKIFQISAIAGSVTAACAICFTLVPMMAIIITFGPFCLIMCTAFTTFAALRLSSDPDKVSKRAHLEKKKKLAQDQRFLAILSRMMSAQTQFFRPHEQWKFFLVWYCTNFVFSTSRVVEIGLGMVFYNPLLV